MSENQNFEIRTLVSGDYYRGFIELLGQLTTVGPITKAQFEEQLERIKSIKNVYVIEDRERIIATATLLLEPKFIHLCGTVGHIEDVVVDNKYRGRGLGLMLTRYLVEQAKEAGCYKVILDCAQHNVPFYEKCGFKLKEVEMVQYFDI